MATNKGNSSTDVLLNQAQKYVIPRVVANQNNKANASTLALAQTPANQRIMQSVAKKNSVATSTPKKELMNAVAETLKINTPKVPENAPIAPIAPAVPSAVTGAITAATGTPIVAEKSTVSAEPTPLQEAYIAQSAQQPSVNTSQSNDLSTLLKAQQAEQEAKLRAQQEAQALAVRQAYDNNLSALEDAYKKQISGLGSTYEATKGQLADDFNLSSSAIERQAEDALREAYINNMLSKKNLHQNLTAQGMSGGAAESTIANLMNNYGNSRNAIEVQRNADLASLRNNYNRTLASALESYNNALANADSTRANARLQLENNLANNVVGTYDNLYGALASQDNVYANAMTNLLTSQAARNAELAAAKYKADLQANNVNTVSAPKKASTLSTTAKNLQDRFNNGEDVQTLAQSLVQEGMSYEEIAKYLEEAGIGY